MADHLIINPLRFHLSSKMLTPVFNRYLPGPKLGEGGFGMVFQAQHRTTQQQVAIKFIAKEKITTMKNPESANGEEVSAELYLLRATRNISGVINLVESYSFAQGLLIIMEMPEMSINLSKLTTQQGGSLEEPLAAHIFSETTRIVLEMQELGIYHNDLKPENILLSLVTYQVHIVDLGCGTANGAEVLYGTKGFTPPEDDGTYCVDPELATVWSLGATLYMLLHGQHMFDLDGKPLPLVLHAHLSWECRQLLRGCLEWEPYRRFTLRHLRNHPWYHEAQRRVPAPITCEDPPPPLTANGYRRLGAHQPVRSPTPEVVISSSRRSGSPGVMSRETRYRPCSPSIYSNGYHPTTPSGSSPYRPNPWVPPPIPPMEPGSPLSSTCYEPRSGSGISLHYEDWDRLPSI